MVLPICPEYRWEKIRAIYAAVFVRILYPFGGKHSEEIAEVQVGKPFVFRNVRQPIHLFVLFEKYPEHIDGWTLHILRMDGDYYVAWHRAVKAEFS